MNIGSAETRNLIRSYQTGELLPDYISSSVVMTAAWTGDLDYFLSGPFIEHKSRLLSKETDFGMTPLELAVCRGHESVVVCILLELANFHLKGAYLIGEMLKKVFKDQERFRAFPLNLALSAIKKLKERIDVTFKYKPK